MTESSQTARGTPIGQSSVAAGSACAYNDHLPHCTVSCYPSVPEDTFRILLATDNHIGYNERDPIRGQDSINTFREILQLAVKNDVSSPDSCTGTQPFFHAVLSIYVDISWTLDQTIDHHALTAQSTIRLTSSSLQVTCFTRIGRRGTRCTKSWLFSESIVLTTGQSKLNFSVILTRARPRDSRTCEASWSSKDKRSDSVQ